jgi:hypothetical protein
MPEAPVLVRRARHQRTLVHVNVRSVDVGRVWNCILCICVSEEGWDGESVDSEALSLLSYTLRYVVSGFIMNR